MGERWGMILVEEGRERLAMQNGLHSLWEEVVVREEGARGRERD